MSHAEAEPSSLAGIGLWPQEGDACYDSARREFTGIGFLCDCLAVGSAW
jgi:hypothetical protein